MARTRRNGATKVDGAPTPSPGDGRMFPPKSGVTVRMYRTGLGDCFLLCFPKKPAAGQRAGATPEPAFVLIDCGVFKGTSGGPARVKKIAEHIRAATKTGPKKDDPSRIDLLVVTHEHWDHLSGFSEAQAQDVFKEIQVGKVWLPWTENHDDPLARQLRGIKQTTMKALHAAYLRLTDRRGPALSADLESSATRVRSVLGMFGIGGEDGKLPATFDRDDGSGKALKWIKETFKESVRFRKPGPDPKDDGALEGVEGVRFFVLGPPHDEDLIRRLNPREKLDEAYSKTKSMAAAVQSAYFAAFGAMPGETIPEDEDPNSASRREEKHRQRSRPFDESYRVELGTAKADDFFVSTYYRPEDDWRLIDADWLAAAGQFALNVDGLANNSSLVLAIELSPGGRVLLFPGDAQIGNWLSWFGKVDYPDGTPRGQDMTWMMDDGRVVDARDLLARTVLYKVGHHGSHNATLKKGGLDSMGTRWPDEFVAMLPVDENVARNHTTYGEMPLNSIVKTLLEMTRGKLLRSDENETPEESKHKLPPSTLGIDGLKPLPSFPGRSDDPNGLYFDYTISKR